MARNLVICCDGSWNTADQHDGKASVIAPTNVRKTYNASKEQDDQLKYYHPGVGTEGGWLAKKAGGMMGAGLNNNIMSAYRWLADHYQENDSIYLFGFSRGAFTVRSLSAMVLSCGLLKTKKTQGLSDDVADDVAWEQIQTIFNKGYRQKNAQWNRETQWPVAQNIKIHFIGVWDTVGALGIPDGSGTLLEAVNVFDNAADYSFHDTNLHPNVTHARHALALDEMRASFTPTLWENVSGRDVKQIWFAGVHADVGGGYDETGLSDIALEWMLNEAKQCGLLLHPNMLEQVGQSKHYRGVLHNSRVGSFDTELLRTQPRAVPLMDDNSQVLHESVQQRRVDPPIAQAPYRLSTLLQAGQKKTCDVFARDKWSETGIYLQAGVEYDFSATGTWLDRDIKCGPGGTDDGHFQVSELAHLGGSLMDKLESIVEKFTKGKKDFYLSKRAQQHPWFALMGVIANAGNPGYDGTPTEHELFLIGKGVRYKPKLSGYLYCFANDSWQFYENNKGKVTLTVSC